MNIDAQKVEILKKRFIALWNADNNPDSKNDALVVWQQLAAYYSGQGRHYHNLNHLLHCVEQMDLALAFIDDPKAMELAILFHDVIYEASGTDNEQLSANWFAQVAGDRFSAEFVSIVNNLILSTTHSTILQNNDEQLICDIDLSSFSLPWEECLRDSNLVREEFSEISDEIYFPAKLKFLDAMLGRPAIYQSEFFYKYYEQQARDNIGRQVSCIRKTIEGSSEPKYECFNL